MATDTERLHWQAHARLEEYAAQDEERLPDGTVRIREGAVPLSVLEEDGNLLLNEGIALWEDLGIGAGGTAYNNANSYLGVGDGTAAAAASQTGLQGASKTYKGMEATYPSRAAQTVTWRSLFGTADANHGWKEWTIANGNSDAAVNLNRKVWVSPPADKTSAVARQLTVTITLA